MWPCVIEKAFRVAKVQTKNYRMVWTVQKSARLASSLRESNLAH